MGFDSPCPDSPAKTLVPTTHSGVPREGDAVCCAQKDSFDVIAALFGRACFKENSSLHISIAKAGLHFLNDHFYQKMSIYPAKFLNDFFVTAQTAFHHCTFRFITAHFVHHCTLKQALLFGPHTIDVDCCQH